MPQAETRIVRTGPILLEKLQHDVIFGHVAFSSVTSEPSADVPW